MSFPTVSTGARPRIRVPALSSTVLAAPASHPSLISLAGAGDAAPPASAALVAAAADTSARAEQDRHDNGRFRNKPRSKRAKRGDAGGDGDEDVDEEEDEDDDDEDGDDDSDDRDMGGSRGKKIRTARARERARCHAILGSDAAANNPETAMQLAFGSARMSRGAAIALLQSMPVRAPAGLANAMAGVPNPQIGPNGEPHRGADAQAVAINASWDRAFKAAGYRKPDERR